MVFDMPTKVFAQSPTSSASAVITTQDISQQGVVEDFLGALFGWLLKRKVGGGGGEVGVPTPPVGGGSPYPTDTGVNPTTPPISGDLKCSEAGQQDLYMKLRRVGIGSDVKARDRICQTCTFSVVRTSNLGCLNSLNPDLARGKGQLESSTKINGYLQCVGWAQYIAQLNYGYGLGPGNAADIRPVSGYRIIENPQQGVIKTGDFIIFKRNASAPFGHIAYVSGVLDSNNFIISEANYGPYGKVNLRYISFASQTGRIARLLRR